MIIEKIVIKSFGAINDMTLEFSPKINVIEGANEAGKAPLPPLSAICSTASIPMITVNAASVKRE